jgi:hypothetical protein
MVHTAGWTSRASRGSLMTTPRGPGGSRVSWSSRRQSTAPPSRSRPPSAGWLGQDRRHRQAMDRVQSVNGYDGVVVGSTYTAAGWVRRQFVDDHAMERRCDHSGCSPAAGRRAAQARGRSGDVAPIATRLGARAHRVFGGRLTGRTSEWANGPSSDWFGRPMAALPARDGTGMGRGDRSRPPVP